MNAHLDFLLSPAYDRMDMHPVQRDDLQRSGLTHETIRRQKIRTVPPHMIDALLGFRASQVASAYIIPFPDPRGGWLDHVRLSAMRATVVTFEESRCSRPSQRPRS